MDSITKRKLTTAEVDHLVKEAFGPNTRVESLTELEGGWFNAVYDLTLSDSREMILKLAPPPQVRVLRYEKEILRVEPAVMRLLKSQSTVLVPQVYFTDYHRTVIDTDYFFMEKIKGQPFSSIKNSLPEETRESIGIDLGSYSRAINQIHGEYFGLFSPGQPKFTRWSEAFIHLLMNLLQDAKDYSIPLPLEYDRIAALITERSALLDEVTVPSLVHWDLHDGNVIIDADGKISAIIDCDRALWGDPLMEFYFCPLADLTYFETGYGRAMLNTREARCRRLMYDLYLWLIMVIECKYRQYCNPRHEAWAYQKLETIATVLGDFTL